MRKVLVGLLAAIAFRGSARGQEVVNEGHWIRPPYDRLKAQWPRDASSGLIYGKVSLDCGVGPKGFAADCKIKGSKPQNPELETAALALAPLYKAIDPKISRSALEIEVEYDQSAEWLRKPTAYQFAAAYPAAAMAQGLSGQALIKCTVSRDGFLQGCSVASESPPNVGFGPAAIVLSRTFLMKPPTRHGQAVEGEITIPVAFKTGPMSGGVILYTTTVLGSTVWAKTPTVPEILSEIDKKVGDKFADGKVVFQCELTKSTGRMKNCIVTNTSPGMAQFTDVAKSLVPKFQAEPKALADIKGDVRINIAFGFPDMGSPAWNGRYLTHPQWTQTISPDPYQPLFPMEAAKAGLKSGSAMVECVVAADGSLTSCKTESESTPGVGFGAIAEQIAGAFKLNPWTEDGLPADGAHVRMPIKMVYEEKAAPTPATTPAASPGSPPPSR